MRLRVLIVDDEPALRFTLVEALADLPVDCVEEARGDSALARLRREPFDLVLSDLRMPGLDGLGLLAATRGLDPAPPFVLITAHGSERAAVEAMKGGAIDYFSKPFSIDEVRAVVGRAIETSALRAENLRLSGLLALSDNLLGHSGPMARVATLIGRLGPRSLPVLIVGEPGTGKHRVAAALMKNSPRAGGPLVRRAGQGLLSEVELGRAVQAAAGGALLIEEPGELGPGAQQRLLDLLLRPEPGPEETRILVLAERDLGAQVRQGRLNEALLRQLRRAEILLPPLRERPGDLPLLASHFLEAACARYGLSTPAVTEDWLATLSSWFWPGNVGELERAIEVMVLSAPESGVNLSTFAVGDGGPAAVELDLRRRVEAFERGLIAQALAASGGNKSEAARRLGINRVTLLDKLRKHGLSAEGEGG